MKTIISTTEAPAAIGAYSQAVVANGMLFASGQLGINPATVLSLVRISVRKPSKQLRMWQQSSMQQVRMLAMW